MIQIREVEVRNWCQHEHQRVQLGPGTNAIIGPNGSGKSNLVGAVSMLLTGTPPLGRLEENIRDGEDDAVLSATFVANGQNGRISRTIRAPYVDTPEGGRERKGTTTKVRLELDGLEAPVTKLADANRLLLELTGVSGSVLNTHVFVGQKDLSKLLFETPAERKAAVMSILPGVSRAEAVYTALYRELSAYPLIELAVPVDEYEQRLREAEGREKMTSQSLAGAEVLAERAAGPAEQARGRLTGHEAAVQAQQQYVQLLPTVKAAYEEAVTAAAVLKAAEEKLGTVDPDYAQMAPVIGKVQAKAADLRARKARAERAAELRQQLENAERRLAGMEPPLAVDPAIVREQTDKRAELADVEAEIRQARKLLVLLESGDPVCSECGRPIENPEAEQSKQEARLVQAAERQDALSSRLHVIDKTLAANQLAFQTYRLEFERLEQQISLLREQISTEGWSDADAAELAKSEEWVGLFEQIREEREAYQKEVTAAQADQVRAESKANQLGDKLDELKEQANARLSESEVKAAKDTISKHDAAASQVFELKAELGAARREAETCRTDLEKARATLKKQEAVRSYRTLLEKAREVFHRDNLPTETMRRFVVRLNRDCNEFLGYFGNPFGVEITKDLDVWVSKPDGYRHAAERLSGGQQCVLSLAFRFATNRIFAPTVGLITLDEPTEYLDTDNVGYLADVMRQLAALNRGSGAQTLVITHAKELLSAFDHVIQLGSGGSV